jgi:glycosyltransferase involved in cell wall biosynthesis
MLAGPPMSPQEAAPLVCVVIPAYNEATVVAGVVGQVCERFPLVVVVDDGSDDGTGDLARAQGATVVTHLFNRGAGAAAVTGIEWALRRGADIIVTFDGDGQHSVDDLDALIAPVREGRVDVVLGSRFLSKGSRVPPVRRAILKTGVHVTRVLAGIRVTDTHNGLRALSREAALRIRIRQDRMAHASEILNEIGRLRLRYCEVPTRVAYTGYSRRKGQRSRNALNVMWELLVG